MKVLIANRGAIAVRLLRTIRELGHLSVVVYADDDLDSLHIDAADEAVSLGGGPVSSTYLNSARILEIAKEKQCDAVHPGYGFLSENPQFETLCQDNGIQFLGPTAAQMKSFGLKHSARELAVANDVPLLPGSGILLDAADALSAADEIGYPVMLKSTAGGGGIGMRLCHDSEALAQAFDQVATLAGNNFGDSGLFLERFVAKARHVEVQVFGDGEGQVIALGTRDCSVQRRQQKVIEECPAPRIEADVLAHMEDAATRLLSSIHYRSAGTVEFIYDESRAEAYFLEVNTRLQVEHGVTEMVYGTDIVAWMLQLADGVLPPLNVLKQALEPDGHAIQVRLYAEDPWLNFQPSPGLLSHVSFPEAAYGRRIDTWVAAGTQISSQYDPMIAKVIAHENSRADAIASLVDTLDEIQLYGTMTNLEYLKQFLSVNREFGEAHLHTGMLDGFDIEQQAVRVVRAGMFTTIQDRRGRTGFWDVGVPPSGPFDTRSFCLGNLALGNAEEASGIEFTLEGPKLEFQLSTRIILTGADFEATLNESPIDVGQIYDVQPGGILDIGSKRGQGMRGYLLIDGGFNVPTYLGSSSTFTLGQFGGHGGRTLCPGDVLSAATPTSLPDTITTVPPPNEFENVNDVWALRVISGPHGAPDFFTEGDIEDLFSHEYEVHFNSSRTGVRLIGPRPQWARENGGEAGLHPSNIHDNAYAIGTIDFTGDMPVILGPDGPSLGGFVCPATVVRADRWKLGQLAPGDKVRFLPVSHETALSLFAEQEKALKGEAFESARQGITLERSDPVITSVALPDDQKLVFRPSGDDYLLVEFGEPSLDIATRFRVHAVHQSLREQQISGVEDLTPGIRSLQIHYQPEKVSRGALIQRVVDAAVTLTGPGHDEVPSRIVYLPLSFDDPVCQQAIEKYTSTVRPDAPWCPSNLEFIRRINGLSSVNEVEQIVFDAAYLVMGLGDVYLGAPVATPVNPAQRLVTTKYNPARTWTAENSVGIGGAYLCIYGMEGPGGYQLVGRTLQMWNRYRQTPVFDRPWLLRFFDQIRFYPVSSDELLELREQFVRGRFEPRIEQTTFNLKDYAKSLKEQSDEINQFQASRECAFATELEVWRENGQLQFDVSESDVTADDDLDVPEGCFLVESQVSGHVWQTVATPGSLVPEETEIIVLESMKMELPIKSHREGKLVKLLVQEGQLVSPGQAVALMEAVA
ncbi:MAG: urea carboxylase [Pseudomonadales bacterium]|nr:urea carboxylase [Pseudomonadales bacterium]MBO6597285.1 urea carboxylase [Pseudomonadales bacterium]MBO6823529.1 urea carboxylase [Pseudomonadales bacterium]